MNPLPPELLGRACRTFMDLAYPGGKETIPERKRPYYDLGASFSLADFIPPAEKASGVARAVKNPKGEVHALEFRLGSSHFPHLKLRAQEVDNPPGPTWVFMVDTHDHFPRVDLGADEAAWRQVQQANRLLKEQIETALEQVGLMTPNKLLRVDLA